MGGDNFNKANSDSKSLFNALKNAQNHRVSTENRLKEELQAQLEVKVSEYVNTLNLEKKISDAAVKGNKRITISLNAHLQETHFSEICIEKSDKNTNISFSKTWDDYYFSMKDLLSVDGINIRLRREATPALSPGKIRPLKNGVHLNKAKVTSAHIFKNKNLVFDAAIPNNSCLRCRGTHRMRRKSQQRSSCRCNHCLGHIAPKEPHMGCDKCNYYLCGKCFVNPPDFGEKEICKYTVGNYVCCLEKNHMLHHPGFPNYGKLIIEWD